MKMNLVNTLQSILDEVHRGFTYIHDIDNQGVNEWWDNVSKGGDINGDCEEFARRCCLLARDKGLNARLVFCGVHNPLGDHLVCEVEGYILDNRSNWVKPKAHIHYTWISISGYSPGDPWCAIK